jgi:hypothetical protein
MKKLSRIIYRIVFMFIGLIGLISCESPTDHHDRQVLRTGETTGGKTFYVIQERIAENHDVLKVHIKGEDEVVIMEDLNWYIIQAQLHSLIASIQISEYSGTPNLFHITWQHTFYDLSDYTYFHYLIVPEGNATQILLRGTRESHYFGHYGFSWTEGWDYYFEYTNQIITIREQCINGGDRNDPDPVCYGTETHLSRSYYVNNESAALMTCEERSRSTEIAWEGMCNASTIEGALEVTPWEEKNLSPEDVTQKCAAIDPNSRIY